jgi:acetyl-CoA C-acetyltransferase
VTGRDGWEAGDVPASTPVLVGVGLVSQRAASAAAAREPLELMVDAALAAGADAGAPRLLERVGQVAVPNGRWRYRDPGRAIAERIGAPLAASLLARVGVLQERLVADAAARIAAGDLDVSLVVGGDAGHRLVQCGKAGVEPSEAQQESEPDVRWRASEAIVTDEEVGAGLGVAAPGYYAIIESAMRARSGATVAGRAEEVAQLYSSMSAVAAANPHAWSPIAVAPEALSPSVDNPMIAAPYTRLHCSDWSVDQASALLLCSAGTARAAGVPAERWVFPQSSAWSDHMVPMTARPRLDEPIGLDAAVTAVLAATGISAADLDLVDAYSCYPAAVRAHATALALGTGAVPTITGGMRFGGGPFNNYVLHAVGQLALRLRAGQGRFGAVTSVSGMLTKHAIGVWGAAPNPAGYQSRDVTSQVARRATARTVRADLQGRATVVGYTVLHERNVPSAAVAVLEAEDGNRTIARSIDRKVLSDLCGGVEQCGRWVTVAAGSFALTPGAARVG